MVRLPVLRTSAEERRRILQSLLLFGGTRRWLAFAFLMTLSIVVATMGLSLDSPAIVIGAMLLAPLMTPIMGFAAALTMAWPRRMLVMGGIVVGTSILGACLAWLITLAQPDPSLTGEILARTRPDVRDLVVALAAGAAGAYATARENVSGALPGVAVAVALVPPLATVGITLELGRYDLARGAMLLYATNLFAIVLVSAVVLLLSGFVPLARISHVSRGLAVGMAVTVLVVAVTALPLAQSSIAVARHQTALSSVEQAVQRWLVDNPGLAVENVALDGSKVTLTLSGPAEPPTPETLATDVAAKLGRKVTIAIRWIQRSAEVASSPPGTGSTVEITRASLKPLVEEWLGKGAADGTSKLGSIELNGSRATIGVFGPVAPPSVASLSAAVTAKFGTWLDISVRWTAQREYTIDTPPDASAIVRNAVNRWIGDRQYLLVEAISVSGNMVIVDLVGEQKPKNVRALAPAIREGLGAKVHVRVRFTPRTVIFSS